MASFKTIRRTGRVWKQISDALYPFDDTSPVVFDNKGKIVALGKQAIFNDEGRVVGYRQRRKSFREAVYRQLPAATIHKFAFFCDDGPDPSEHEFSKFRRQLLGTARRMLLREQLQRIRSLPHLPGRGRLGINDKEQNEIRQKFNELRNNPEVGTATRAVEVLAERYGYRIRNIWKILSRTKKTAVV